jgi:hypothetical protein
MSNFRKLIKLFLQKLKAGFSGSITGGIIG